MAFSLADIPSHIHARSTRMARAIENARLDLGRFLSTTDYNGRGTCYKNQRKNPLNVIQHSGFPRNSGS